MAPRNKSAQAQEAIDTTLTSAAIAAEDTTPPMQEAIDTTPAAEDAAPIDTTPETPAAAAEDVAPAAETPAPTPVEMAQDALAQIDAALAVMRADNPASFVLQAARIDAIGALALAEAQAQEDAEKQAQIDAVNALTPTCSQPLRRTTRRCLRRLRTPRLRLSLRRLRADASR